MKIINVHSYVVGGHSLTQSLVVKLVVNITFVKLVGSRIKLLELVFEKVTSPNGNSLKSFPEDGIPGKGLLNFPQVSQPFVV